MTKQHEQDYETVRHGLVTAYYEGQAALIRLRDAAAKVPGLEADNAALLMRGRALHDAASFATDVMSYGRQRDELVSALSAHYFAPVDAPEKCVICEGSGVDVDTDEEGGTRNERHFPCSRCKGSGRTHPGAALLERLAKAEKTVADYNLAVEWHSCCPDLALRTEQLHIAESERDAAQQEAHRLSNALALEQTTRDRAVGEADTLRERVATLEREKSHLQCEFEAEETRGDEEQRRGDAAEDRADAAEARVRELEAAIRAKRDDYRANYGEDKEGPHPMVDWAERVLRGASQPPPAPTQGVAEYINREDEASRAATSLAVRHRHRGRVEGASAALRLATPTQPALVVPDEVRTALAGYLYEAQDLHGPVRELLAPGGRGRLTLATLRQVADILGVKPGVAR